MSVLDKAVTKAGDDTWDFQCPGIAGSNCGDAIPFRSTGWPTKKAAMARGQQHFDEHKGLGASQSLEDFRRDQGLTVDADGVVTVKDI